MTDEERLKKIANAFLVESQSDYEAVSLLIENKKFNLAIYHAQQCVEKLLKACLATEGKIGIYRHEIFYFFKDFLQNKFSKGDMDVLEENIPELEEEWSATRYPGWENDQIWVPSKEYTQEDATDMETKMKASRTILTKFLKAKHTIEIGEKSSEKGLSGRQLESGGVEKPT